MTTPTVEAFSISHAAVLNGSTGAEEAVGDIYGVREGSLEIDQDEYNNTGDDNVLSSWYWFNWALVTIKSGYLPLPLLALLYGQTVTSSGSSPNDYFSIPLFDEDSLNNPTRPMIIRCPSKDPDGNIRDLDFVLYKCFFKPLAFEGPSYKEGLVVNYSAKALISDKDEKGTTLAKKAIGRLVSRPSA